MVIRAVIVWMTIVPVAIVNGAVRDLLIAPSVGDSLARALSCLILAAAVFLVARLTTRWMSPKTAGDAWRIGAIWLVLTLGFEFLVGHYGFGTSWDALLEDYNLLDGRLWIIVLASTFSAPRLALGTWRHFRISAHATILAAVTMLAWTGSTTSAMSPMVR